MASKAELDNPTEGQELLDRVEQLTAAIDASADPFLRATVDELVSAIIELYGEGLTRIVHAVSEQGDDSLLRRLAGDSVIGSLMLIHDLYPVPLEVRVQEALASVRPYMESHGGDVELLRLEDGVAHLRLVGHCHGCPASAATLELAIKEALDDAAPDLLGLEVEGVAEPKPVRKPLAMVASDSGGGAARWLPLAQAGAIEPGTFRALELEGVDLVVANVDGTVLAYRDRCAACDATLRDAALVGPLLTCASCGCAFDLPRAGRAVDREVQLEPIPLLRRDERVFEVALA
jgi:Fe-S cluster biogenesis protein NfuA/nitrite reductase/ring-hydroxylating ferredoxin subunit